MPASFAQVVEQNSLSYVIPIAQCDLNLSLEDKGLLLTGTYAGSITISYKLVSQQLYFSSYRDRNIE